MRPSSLRLRSLLVLAGVLALPAPTPADVPQSGQVVPANGEDQYFNKAECEASDATVELSWKLAGTVSSGVIRLYATNTKPVAASGSTVVKCEIEDRDATPAIYAGDLDPPGEIIAGTGDIERTLDVNIGLLLDAGTEGDTADCAKEVTVYVCAEFFPYQSGTTVPVDEPSASAWGTFLLETSTPATPTGLSLKVGDTRLYAKWSAGSGGAAVSDYRVVATPGNAALPTRTKISTTTSATLDGLQNDTEYQVQVFARSVSGTPSVGSDVQSAIPREVKDFWDVYQDQGGPEQGGCGGPAGPLALLGLAGLLALAGAGRRP